MALNFPNSPGIGSVFTDSTSGFSYEWDGTVWKSYSPASASNIKILDDLAASFNGSTVTFALTSNSVSLTPANAQSLIINLGGVVQEPGVDYTVNTSNITFTTAPEAALSFSGVSLGPAIPISTIVDGATTQGSFNVVGVLSTANLRVSGVSTFVGLATHTGSIFGSNLSLTGVATASSFVGSLTGTATGLSGTPNITVGFITATEYDITGSSNTLNASGLNVGVATATTLKVGTAVTISAGVVTATEYDILGSVNTFNTSGINVSGVVTATSFSGSGANLTGLPAGYTELDGMLFG